MSEQFKPLLSKEDTTDVAERLSRILSESLSKQFPRGLSERQFKTLKKELLASLQEETLLDAQRVIRRFVEKENRREKLSKKERRKKSFAEDSVERLTLQQRLQHMILFTSTLLLIVTGLPIKFHEAPAANFVIRLLGGANVTRILHRIGALGLTIVGGYHLLYCLVFEEGRKSFGQLLPSLQDLKDILQQIGYFLGFKQERPLFHRYSYVEKFDYWAVYWGMVVMIASGYILWFMEAAINHFGKVSYDIAREAHSDEGLLATLAIIIWHFYNVHFNPKKFPGSLTWWHGRISLEEFREEHALEYEEWLVRQKKSRENGETSESLESRKIGLTTEVEGGKLS